MRKPISYYIMDGVLSFDSFVDKIFESAYDNIRYAYDKLLDRDLCEQIEFRDENGNAKIGCRWSSRYYNPLRFNSKICKLHSLETEYPIQTKKHGLKRTHYRCKARLEKN